MRSCYIFFFLLQRTIFTIIVIFIRNNPRTQSTLLFFLFLAVSIFSVANIQQLDVHIRYKVQAILIKN